MGDRSVRVEVRGIRELDRALKAADESVRRDLKSSMHAIATSVADAARALVPVRTGSAAGSITARSSPRGAAIAYGGQRAPYFPWLDFGGSTGRGHKPGVAWSGAVRRAWEGRPAGEGRYAYPAMRSQRADIARRVDEAVETAARSAGFATRET